MKIGLINNPLSRSNRERGVARIARLAETHGVEVAAEADMSGLDATLSRFADAGVELLAINGGDGTVRNVLTHIWRERPFETPPMLAVLRGGRSNAIAMDCGLPGAPDRAFRRLLAAAAEGRLEQHVQERALIRIEGAGAGVQYGMLLVAAGAIAVVDYSRSHIDPLGLPAWASDLISLISIATRSLRKPKYHAFDGHEIRGDIDGAPLPFERTALLMATTLDTLVMRARPYWNAESGPIRFTLMAHPPKDMVRRLPSLLYGGPRKNPPPEHYFSRGGREVTLRFTGRFLLDGEFFEAPASGPLRLSAHESARFVVL